VNVTSATKFCLFDHSAGRNATPVLSAVGEKGWPEHSGLEAMFGHCFVATGPTEGLSLWWPKSFQMAPGIATANNRLSDQLASEFVAGIFLMDNCASAVA